MVVSEPARRQHCVRRPSLHPDPAELKLEMMLSDAADTADDLLRELNPTIDNPADLARRIYLYCAASALWDEWSTIGHPELELESLIEDHEPAPWYDPVRLYAPLRGAKRSPIAHEERVSRVLASERDILEKS